jgi:hypothetical protein
MALAFSVTTVASATPAPFHVQPVGRAQVKRLLIWSLQAPVVKGESTQPTTCAKDHLSVYMLPLPAGPGTADVSCTVPTYSWLVVNVGGEVCFAKPGAAAADLVSGCQELLTKTIQTETLTVDGKPAKLSANASSGPFTVTLTDPTNPAVSLPVTTDFEGRNVMLTGLPKGTHDIRLQAHVVAPSDPTKTADIDLTYHVTFA